MAVGRWQLAGGSWQVAVGRWQGWHYVSPPAGSWGKKRDIAGGGGAAFYVLMFGCCTQPCSPWLVKLNTAGHISYISIARHSAVANWHSLERASKTNQFIQKMFKKRLPILIILTGGFLLFGFLLRSGPHLASVWQAVGSQGDNPTQVVQS